MNKDVGEMLVNLSQSYPQIILMITSFCYVAGIVLAFRAVYNLKIYGELRTMMPSQASLKTPVTYLIVAAVFVYLPTAMGTLMQSTFGYSEAQQLMTYITVETQRGQEILRAVLGLVQIVGLMAFVRGWWLLTKGAQQGTQEVLGKALTHIIGGLLAINIEGTWKLLAGTLGIEV